MEAQILIKFINDHQYHHLAYVDEDWFYDDYDEGKKYSDSTDEYTNLDYEKLPNIRVGKWEKKFIFSVVSEHGGSKHLTPKLQAQFTRIYNKKKQDIDLALQAIEKMDTMLKECKESMTFIDEAVHNAPSIKEIVGIYKKCEDLEFKYKRLENSKKLLSDEFMRFVKRYYR